MSTGAITNHIDVAQVVLYAFWIFFAGLLIYIRREDKREGYPLESERSGAVRVQGWPAMPEPKSYKLPHGGTVLKPDPKPEVARQILAVPTELWPGAPLEADRQPDARQRGAVVLCPPRRRAGHDARSASRRSCRCASPPTSASPASVPIRGAWRSSVATARSAAS